MIDRLIDPQSRFVAMASYHNVFREDLINDIRSSDSMVQSLEDLCKIIEETMKPNITYLGHEVVDARVKYPDGYIQMYDSDTYCVEFKFKIEGTNKKGEHEIRYKKMVFEIPNLINGEYYLINGSRSYPIYQLLDATTYHRNDGVTLKTLTLPIKMNRQPGIIIDINGKEYTSFVYTIDIQKKSLNMLIFFFATLGFFRTLKFFEGATSIFYFVSSDMVEDSEEFTYFKITDDIYLKIRSEYMNEYKFINIRSMIAMILQACNQKITIDQIRDVGYWRYDIFAHVFIKSKTAKPAKIDLFIESYKRLYDSITKTNMANYEEPKDNIYEVLRWMFTNYKKLSQRDNSNIFNKRIRLSEYQIAPIVRRVTFKMQRVMNSRKRNMTPEKMEGILQLPFKMVLDPRTYKKDDQSSDILIKSIINSNNTKYADCVNDMNLFNIALKWTLNAPSTTPAKGSKSKSLTLAQRAQSPTFIGIISLNTSGAGDPGGTGCFTPFAHVYPGGSFREPNIAQKPLSIEEIEKGKE